MDKSNSIKSRTNVVTWLFTGCFLVFVMVIVGGITRLTGSGLSITEWKIITGTLPPFTESAWTEEFSKYTESPQFEQINSHFGLSEFKSIYWWEYLHRLLGRLIGLVFIFPWIYFIITKQLSTSMIWKSLILFLMGGLQGFLGWYMVKSGLVNDPNVSHYRLALHLTTAFITFGLTFWFALGILAQKRNKAPSSYSIVALVILFVVLVQIVFGAFVAGLDAGYVYNTFPKMDGKWIADSVRFAWMNDGIMGLFNSLGGVQFIHRYMAYVVTAIIILELIRVHRTEDIQVKVPGIMRAYQFLGLMVIVQFFLGVITLLYNVPVVMGVVHQAGAFILFAGAIYLLHRLNHQT